MLQVLGSTVETAVVIDLVIGLAGLIFMCMLTYAMRWLPGRSLNYEEHVAVEADYLADELLEAQPTEAEASIAVSAVKKEKEIQLTLVND